MLMCSAGIRAVGAAHSIFERNPPYMKRIKGVTLVVDYLSSLRIVFYHPGYVDGIVPVSLPRFSRSRLIYRYDQ